IRCCKSIPSLCTNTNAMKRSIFKDYLHSISRFCTRSCQILKINLIMKAVDFMKPITFSKVSLMMFVTVAIFFLGNENSPWKLTLNAVHAASFSTYFPIGTGGSDVIPHQIVRTNTDHLYIFANQQSSNILRVYRTVSTGLPGNSGDFAAPIQITETSNLISVDAVYDGGNFIHVLIN